MCSIAVCTVSVSVRLFTVTVIMTCPRLDKAYKACDKLSVAAIHHIMAETDAGSPVDSTEHQPTRRRAFFKELEKFRVLEKPAELVVTSTLARKTDSVQEIAIESHLDFEVG